MPLLLVISLANSCSAIVTHFSVTFIYFLQGIFCWRQLRLFVFCGVAAFVAALQQHVHKKSCVHTDAWCGLTHNLKGHGIGNCHPLLSVDVAGGSALVFALVLVGDIVDDQARLISALHVL